MRNITKKPTHCIPEAVIFVDVPCAGAQLDAVAQTHSSPLSLVEITSWDVVHLARLAAFIDHILLAETQPPVTLQLHKIRRKTKRSNEETTNRIS